MSVLLKLNTERNVFNILPKEMRGEEIIKIGSEFKSGTSDPVRGLDPILEANILPDKIGIRSHEVGWAAAAREFWANFSFAPSSGGIILDISTHKKKVKDPSTGEDIEVDFPNNPDHYMKWRWASQCTYQVGIVGEVEDESRYDFLIIDLNKQKKKENQQYELKELADKNFIDLVADAEHDSKKLDMVISLIKEFHESVDGFDLVEKKKFLSAKKDKDPKKFNDILTDPFLETKSLINKLLEYQVISKEGNSYFDGEALLGDSLKSTVAYFNNATKSEHVVKLKARLKEIVTKSKKELNETKK